MSSRRSSRLLALALGTSVVLVAAGPIGDQVSISSRPDRVVVFLNGIAFAQDTVTIPGGVNVRAVMPSSVYPDTLILREDGERVRDYRMAFGPDGAAVEWQSQAEGELREITIEYLLGGMSWRPKYDMWIGADTDETVDFDFFAEIRNDALELEDVEIQLVAGRVDTSRLVDAVSQITANQLIAGYEEPVVGEAPTGQVSIQHVYDTGTVSGDRGQTIGLGLAESTLPARRLHVWNAPVDDQVTVIYKVRNDSELPFAEGTVRSYQDDMFIGSDFIELTPVGGEGSVTVGQLQDVRVSRSESRSSIAEGKYDYLHEVELEITNLGADPVTIEAVDRWQPEAEQLHFSLEPGREAGNLLRWVITVEPGETTTIEYDFRVD